ncbi:MAG TPA: prepilin-type N-terminal cleavage/methylation domain-containing protein [Rariglobus sp.]|jgi:prepilin-type N-terminal cleavage/methylation domain-containing protein|nr:prepilin-type N-terminal cleavage/methylation domain-containing protein [Rariglobus sp.]
MSLLSPKYPSSRRAFTLIELLTVIAIIGILAAILIPAVGAAKNAANRAKTKSQFGQWATAMTSFKQEYGYYPIICTGDRVNANNTHGVEFANALAGKKNLKGESYDSNSSPTAAQVYGNTKLIGFYTIGSGDLDLTDPSTPYLIDAFGNSDIVVRVDTNSDGKIDNTDPVRTDSTGSGYLAGSSGWPTVQANTPPSGQAFDVTNADTSLAANGVRAGVVFYSAGKGTTDTDIITTWQ